MKKLIIVFLAATGLAAVASTSTHGHHSTAVFDYGTEITIKGTVSSFSYRNPHAYLNVDVEGEDGTVDTWTLEMSNVTNMRSRGILQSTFSPGDEVTVRLNPLKNGRPGGRYVSAIGADGKTHE